MFPQVLDFLVCVFVFLSITDLMSCMCFFLSIFPVSSVGFPGLGVFKYFFPVGLRLWLISSSCPVCQCVYLYTLMALYSSAPISILHGFSWVWCFWFAFVMGDLHLFHFGGALFIKVSFIANIVHEYIVILECGVFIFVIIRVFYVCVIVTFYNLPHFSPVLISLSSQFLSIFVWFSPGTNPCALRFSLFSAIVGTGLTFVFLYLFFFISYFRVIAWYTLSAYSRYGVVFGMVVGC